LVIAAVSCATIYTARGAYHRIQRGDTLSSIARQYHADLQEVAELNDIERDSELRVGRSLFIPGVRRAKYPSRSKKKGRPGATAASQIQTEHGKYIWPVHGEISSLYGVRRGRRHDGLDIRAPRGTPVVAAADGEVAYAKRMMGYGNLVIVEHPDGFFTVYAHNSVNLVRKGKKVKRGETIAKVGSTGRATGPHVHFEVREGSHARNPLFFLPETALAKKARQSEAFKKGG